MHPAPPDSWREYNPANPDPGYFEFDWLSARHPDLYHRFALSTIGLMQELDTLVDLTDKEVVDVAAGTGRASAAAAREARTVVAVDAYKSVVDFGRAEMDRLGLDNVRYVVADAAQMPLKDASADVVICAWGMLNYAEARRILRPGGFLAHMACAPGSLCGELTAVLAPDFPDLLKDAAPPEQFHPRLPSRRRRTNTKRTRNPDEDPRLQLHRRLRRPRRSSSSPRAPLRAQSQAIHDRQSESHTGLATPHLLRHRLLIRHMPPAQ